MMVPFASTKKLLKLVRKANERGYNRRVNSETLEDEIDPDGRHVVWWNMLEGDSGIVRTSWMVKVRGSDEPLEITLDMDIGDFNNLSRLVGT